MITEQALQEAIAEVQGKRDPNRQDCMMLAAFYTIQDRLFPEEREIPVMRYSGAPEPEQRSTGGELAVYGNSDFLRAVSGKDPAFVLPIMDELMDTMKMVNERVYNSVMRKLR